MTDITLRAEDAVEFLQAWTTTERHRLVESLNAFTHTNAYPLDALAGFAFLLGAAPVKLGEAGGEEVKARDVATPGARQRGVPGTRQVRAVLLRATG